MVIKLEIKKGDSVEIITSDDKDKTDKVLVVYPKTLKVVVGDCKIAKKAIKPSEKNPNGGFVNKEVPMDISNATKI